MSRQAGVVDQKQITGILLGIATVVALAVAMRIRGGGDVHCRDGTLHDDHGQCVRGLSGDAGGDRFATHHYALWRQRDRHGGRRYAVGFLRTADDADGGGYNIVPTALLELPDEYAVIKAQIPTALLLLTVNTLIMYTFVFRR